VIAIFNYNHQRPRCEIFHYNNGRLEYSETFEVLNSLNGELYVGTPKDRLYETRYIYEDDKIVKSEVFYNGYPTRSYDEYEYTEDGKLNVVKRYELGKLTETYYYCGMSVPVGVKCIGQVFLPEYDDKGNVTGAQIKSLRESPIDFDISLQYSNDLPVRTVKTSIGGARSSVRELNFSYHSNGNLSKETYCYYLYNLDGTLDNRPKTEVSYYDEEGHPTLSQHTHGTREVVYDEYGNIKEIQEVFNSQNITTTFVYDIDGRIIKKIVDEPRAAYPITWYEYDENGRVTRYVRLDNGEECGITYEYYPNGAKKKQIEKMYADRGADIKTYSENGNLILLEYANGDYCEYIRSEICYDFSRKLSLKELQNDAAGSRATKIVLSGGHSNEYEYNEDFLLIKQVSREKDGSMLVINFNGENNPIKAIRYDSDGNVIYEKIYDKIDGDSIAT